MIEESDLSRVWGTFIARHFAFDPKKLSALPMGEVDEKIKNWGRERLFLYRMDIDYSFNRLIHDKTEGLGWIDSHIEQLTFLILMDLVRSDQTTLKDIEEFLQERRRKGYERDGRAAQGVMNERNARRLFREYYPEVFYFPDAKAGDGRFTPITSIFSTQEGPMENEDTGLYQYLLKIDFVKKAIIFGGPQQANHFYQTMRVHSSMLRLADPVYVERLVKYRDLVRPYYQALASKFGHSFERKSIFLEGEPLNDHQVIALYAFVHTAVLLRWFRKLRPEQKEKVLFGKKRFVYTKLEAKRAIAANREWSSDAYYVSQILTNGAIAYANALRQSETSAIILETLIEEVDMDEVDLAATLHNLGSAYHKLRKPKKAISMFNLSKDIWKRLGFPGNVAIVLASISALYASESKMDQSDQAFQEALSLIDRTSDSVDKVVALLHLVQCIDFVKDEREALRVLEEGIRITSQGLDIPLKYNAIFFDNWLLKTVGSPYRHEFSCSGIPDIAKDVKFIETPYSSFIPITEHHDLEPESVKRAAAIRARYFPK